MQRLAAGARRSSVTLAVVAVFAVLATVVLAAPGANVQEPAPKVRTLATVNGVIVAFDQDGNRLASLERPTKGCSSGAPGALVVRTVGGRPARIRTGWACYPPQVRCSSSAVSVLPWAAKTQTSMATPSTAASPGSPSAIAAFGEVEQLEFAPDGEGAWLSDIAADGAIVETGVLLGPAAPGLLADASRVPPRPARRTAQPARPPVDSNSWLPASCATRRRRRPCRDRAGTDGRLRLQRRPGMVAGRELARLLNPPRRRLGSRDRPGRRRGDKGHRQLDE